MQRPDFTTVKHLGPEGAVTLLRSRFPDLATEFSNPDNLEPNDPYHSYERFAEEVMVRRNETALLDRVFRFINELAVSSDHMLEDLLTVAVLESFAQDREFADLLYANIDPKPEETLRAIEKHYYGRTR